MQQNKWLVRISIAAFFIIAATIGLQLWTNRQAQLGVNEMIEQMSPVAKIEYKSISANPWTGMVHIHGISLRAAQGSLLPLYIKDLGIKAKKSPENHLTHLKLNIHGLDLPIGYADVYPLVRQILHHHGKMILKGDLFADYQYSQAKAQMQLLLYTQFDSLGKLEINLTAQPYIPNVLSPARLSSLPLRKFDLIYQDQSLIQKLWSVLGAQEGHSQAEYQESLVRDLNKNIIQTENSPVRYSLIALREFVERPNYLRIHMTTLLPTSLQQLQALSQEEAQQRVDIRITSKQG